MKVKMKQKEIIEEPKEMRKINIYEAINQIQIYLKIEHQLSQLLLLLINLLWLINSEIYLRKILTMVFLSLVII